MLYDIQRENVKLKKKIMKEEDEILLMKSQIQKFNKKIQDIKVLYNIFLLILTIERKRDYRSKT